MWENLGARAKSTVKMASNICQKMHFCKAGFNLDGDTDGLSFVTGTEIKKLEKVLCDGDFNCDRVNKATVIAADIMNPVFQRQATIISELDNNTLSIQDGIAQLVAETDELKERKNEEGENLSEDDNVTLSRRVGSDQVNRRIVRVYFKENGKVSYDIKPDRGAHF